MRVPPPILANAMASQVRACLSELPQAPSAVRSEMLSIASTLRYLSAELAYGADCAKARDEAAELLQARLRAEGLALPAEVAAILEAMASPAVAPETSALIFGWLVEFLRACNQAELGMYRRGLQDRGRKE